MTRRKTIAIDILALFIVVLMGLWYAFPTSAFIVPQSILYNGRDVVFVRLTPFGGMHGDWVTDIEMINSDKECTADGKAYYQVVDDGSKKNFAKNTVRYRTDPRLWPCLDSFGEKKITHYRTAKLFNILPLRTSQDTITLRN